MEASKHLMELLKPGSSGIISLGSLATLIQRLRLSRWIRFLAHESKDKIQTFLKGMTCLAAQGPYSLAASDNLLVIRISKEAFYRQPGVNSGSVNTNIKRTIERLFGRPFPRMTRWAYLVWSRHPLVIPYGITIAQAGILEVSKWAINREVGTLWAWILYATGGGDEDFLEWRRSNQSPLPGKYLRSYSKSMDHP